MQEERFERLFVLLFERLRQATMFATQRLLGERRHHPLSEQVVIRRELQILGTGFPKDVLIAQATHHRHDRGFDTGCLAAQEIGSGIAETEMVCTSATSSVSSSPSLRATKPSTRSSGNSAVPPSTANTRAISWRGTDCPPRAPRHAAAPCLPRRERADASTPGEPLVAEGFELEHRIPARRNSRRSTMRIARLVFAVDVAVGHEGQERRCVVAPHDVQQEVHGIEVRPIADRRSTTRPCALPPPDPADLERRRNPCGAGHWDRPAPRRTGAVASTARFGNEAQARKDPSQGESPARHELRPLLGIEIADVASQAVDHSVHAWKGTLSARVQIEDSTNASFARSARKLWTRRLLPAPGAPLIRTVRPSHRSCNDSQLRA